MYYTKEQSAAAKAQVEVGRAQVVEMERKNDIKEVKHGLMSKEYFEKKWGTDQ